MNCGKIGRCPLIESNHIYGAKTRDYKSQRQKLQYSLLELSSHEPSSFSEVLIQGRHQSPYMVLGKDLRIMKNDLWVEN